MAEKASDEKLAKLVEIAEKRGVKVDDVTRDVLAYFGGGNCLVYFHASGFGHQSPDLMRKLSGDLGLDYLDVSTAATWLERRGLLEETKGMSSIGGKEYWYGLAEDVKHELDNGCSGDRLEKK